MPIESVMPSNHLILCRPLLLLPSIFPSIRVFSNESVFCIRWPKYWSFSINISPSNEHPGLIFSRMDWLDLLAVQGTLKSLLQHHSSKALTLLYWMYCTYCTKCQTVTFLYVSHPLFLCCLLPDSGWILEEQVPTRRGIYKASISHQNPNTDRKPWNLVSHIWFPLNCVSFPPFPGAFPRLLLSPEPGRHLLLGRVWVSFLSVPTIQW